MAELSGLLSSGVSSCIVNGGGGGGGGEKEGKKGSNL